MDDASNGDETGQNKIQNSNEKESVLFTIAGRKGFFTETTSIHEKYAMRPKGVEKLTLSQFAISYSRCAKKPKTIIMNEDGITEEKEYYANSIFEKNYKRTNYVVSLQQYNSDR